MNLMTVIALVFGISMLLSGLVIPKIIRISFRRRLFDKADGRKVHRGTVPRLGGVSFVPSVMFAVSLVLGLYSDFESVRLYFLESGMIGPVLLLLCSVTLLFWVGVSDDMVGVRYSTKFWLQACCGLLTVVSGVYVGNFYGLLGMNEVPASVGWGLSAFMVVYIVNSVNLIDGIDGLAAGICSLALLVYGIFFYLNGNVICLMLSWGMLGALIAFFYYNVFGKSTHCNKTFMGDTGSLTLGMVVAFLSIELARTPMAEPFEGCDPLIAAFCPLFIPLFDVVRVCLHRFKKGRNLFLPDRGHIHHKLLAMGMSSGMALLVILCSSAVFIISNILLGAKVDSNILLGADIIVWTVVNILLTRLIRRKERITGTHLYL
ncbi:MAG: undecaprenyl/decaprenyl-phosphate alpha-N-acetylglucosaminyl 1-phosphate transferase [Muribaculum sp.]|nr:undecaprenyl/decaprenyl-phosphate alpha-N-acetylglucosaminyl 1-phosphate transferase [Muribaculum sp.]